MRAAWSILLVFGLPLASWAEHGRGNDPQKARATIEAVTESGCVPMWLTSSEGPIPYWLDTQTRKKYFAPEVELKDLRLIGVQGETLDFSQIDEHMEFSFRMEPTARSRQEFERLKQEMGDIESLEGRETIQFEAFIPDEKNEIKRDGKSVVVIASRNAYSLTRVLTKTPTPPTPRIAYENPCGQKQRIAARLAAVGKVELGFRGVSLGSSYYSLETTRTIDRLRAEYRKTEDPYLKWRATYDAIRLRLDAPTARDKAIMQSLNLDATQIAHALADKLVDDGNNPVVFEPGVGGIYDVAPEIFRHFVLDRLVQIRTPNGFEPYLVNDPEQRTKLNSEKSEGIEKSREEVEALARDKKVIPVLQDKLNGWYRDYLTPFPLDERPTTLCRRSSDWDEDADGRFINLRQNIEYEKYQPAAK